MFENLLSNEYKGDSFVVVNKKLKKKYKQLIAWLYSIPFPHFIITWLGKDHMVHAVFGSKLFLPDDTVSLIQECVRKQRTSYFETKNLTLTTGVRVYLVSS